jgi:hypothetical protein
VGSVLAIIPRILSVRTLSTQILREMPRTVEYQHIADAWG